MMINYMFDIHVINIAYEWMTHAFFYLNQDSLLKRWKVSNLSSDVIAHLYKKLKERKTMFQKLFPCVPIWDEGKRTKAF